MEIHLLLVSLLVLITVSSAIQTIAPLVMPSKQEHHEDKIHNAKKETSPNQQKSILEFLSAFDQVQKSASHRLIPKTAKFQAYAKTMGKTIKRELLSKRQSRIPFFQQVDAAESSKDFRKRYALTGKNFKKAAIQPSKKPKQRACFWKYCVQIK